MDGRNEMSGATGEPRRPAVAPVNLPARISPDGGQDSPYEATVNGSLSARRPQSARVKPQRPNSARASSAQFRRTYSVPPPQGAIAAHGHSGYYHGPPGTPRGPGHYDDYGPGVGIPPPSPWTAGVQVPVFSPWGYDLAWGAQSGGSAYGMAMAGGGMPRRCDKPTRIVFVGEVPKGVSDERLQEAAAKHGAIRGLDATQREASGGVFVMYYDLRDAEEALKGLPAAIRTMDAAQGEQLRVMACFMLPPVGVAGMENQAIIALPSCEMSRSELRSMFGKFGEIRDVRRGGGHGQGPDWRVVEFFDTRDAERAMADIRSRKGPKAEYAPFSGLENACHPVSPPPYGMYQQGYPVSGPVAPKREEAGMPGGFEAPGHAAPPAVWPVASMGTPTGGYGVWPFTVAPAAHPAGYGREGLQPASRSMGEAGGAGDGVGESGYAMPQNCRADYYCGPQYMGYPTGMPAMLPFGPGGQPLMIPTAGMYDAGLMTSLRPEMPTSPVHTSSATETHAWRPHRTGRGASERTYDPAQFEFSLDEARTKSTTARTTLMIRNIPNKYSQKMLLDVLDRKYSGRYDFFYLPIDFKNRCNLGYAFVNFRNSSTTAEFYKEFHSKSWEEFNSKKVCEITYARVQGRNALIEHFRNSRFPCNEPDYLPLVFEAVDEANHGKKASRPVTKATPVHHWTTMHYPNNAAVAAH